MNALFAFSPILVTIILMLGFRYSAKKALPIAMLLQIVIAFFLWKITILHIAAFCVYGFLKAFDIFIIIFGAILFLNTLKVSGAMSRIGQGFQNVSKDPRIQVIIIGWMFGAFLEGASGFGTPAVLGAALLVSLGFPPSAAVMTALLLNSTAVTFGAAGTPFLAAMSTITDNVKTMGGSPEDFMRQLARQSAFIHGVIGIIVPFLAVAMLTKLYGKEKSIKPALQILPYGIMSGFAFAVPNLIVATLIGPELPSVIGGLLGLPVVIIAAQKKFLIPKMEWEFASDGSKKKEEKPTDEYPYHRIENARKSNRIEDRRKIGEIKIVTVENNKEINMSQKKAWLPYVLVTLILLITRIPFFRINDILSKQTIPFQNILGVSGLTHNIKWAYLPGILPFALIAVFSWFYYRLNRKQIRTVWKNTTQQTYGAAIALFCGVAMVQLMLNSGLNHSGFDSMTITIANAVARITGVTYPVFAPFLGALGTFIAGSSTISNVLFSSMQFETAIYLNMAPIYIVTLQVVGSAAGAMISLNNIVIASSAVGLKGMEGKILRRNILPMIIYCILATILVFMLN